MTISLRALGFAVALAALPVAGASATELVSNGGFETGDFSGWTLSGNTGFTDVEVGVEHSGTFGGLFGQVGSTGMIEQTLTTVAGQNYSLSFWLLNSGGPANSFEASIDGGAVLSLNDSPAFDYTHYTFNFTASGTSTDLAFTFRQDPSFWFLDDVSVTGSTGAPEPATIALLGAGIAGFGAIRRKRK
jgi:flagellin